MLSKSLKYCKWSELNSVNSEIELSQTKWTQLLLNCKIMEHHISFLDVTKKLQILRKGAHKWI
jgi:hypothetical protein